MNIASIDIGTNTVLLLVANYNNRNGKLKPLLNEYRMPRIGKGLNYGKPISKSAQDKLYDILGDYKELISNYNCTKILLTGTNALRIASNSGDISRKIQEKFGFNLSIISGEQEANYSFLGSAHGTNSEMPKLVIDIGGGSTELIIGYDEKIINSKSFSFGAVSLTEKYISRVYTNDRFIELIRAEIQQTIGTFIKTLPPVYQTICVAGTPTSLSCIKQNLKVYDENKVNNSKLKLSFLEEMIEEFTSATPSEILKNYGSVVEGREDIIFAGTIILAEICRSFGINEVLVSSKGIRYGAIINYLKTEYQNGK